jgi:hypothetical protein
MQFETVSNCKSDYFNCDMGVRQGENVSPFLFAMFLNDLQMFFENAGLNGLETVSNCQVMCSTSFQNFKHCFCSFFGLLFNSLLKFPVLLNNI